MNKKQILLELQSFGARLDVPVEEHGRCGGAGPSAITGYENSG